MPAQTTTATLATSAAGASPRPVPIFLRRANDAWRNRVLYLFLLPFAALTALFGLWPIGESIVVAFTRSATALSDAPEWAGLANFRSVLSDPAFLASLWRTLFFTVASVALNLGLALALALLLAHPLLRRGRTLFKLAVFLPVVTPDVAGFITWKWLVNTNFGALNAVLLSLGLAPFPGVTQPWTAFGTLVAVEAWHNVGLYALIFLTNLQLLDQGLTEAARIDGANAWQRFRYVVLPQLRPAIAVNAVYALIQFLKTFTVVVVITKGGPNYATNFVSYYAYSKFDVALYGEATAMATILFTMVFVLAAAVLWLGERGEAR
ncbi:carbohydrate ABC transporter permease [Roseomonas elaeocarpi]|uniref:Carbohydrate ABC transporter permease n=1 Tax=Roseomonas elaeocarpi TaxID=907779 RepID=A0ABV6JMI9_9PROT